MLSSLAGLEEGEEKGQQNSAGPDDGDPPDEPPPEKRISRDLTMVNH